MAESEKYCECCGKPMQILYTREYVEKAMKEERERFMLACATSGMIYDAEELTVEGWNRLTPGIDGARKEMQERCAKVCDEIAVKYWTDYKQGPDRGDPYFEGITDGAEMCAEAIRNGGTA